MDRLITYPGALPLDTDILTGQKNAHIAVGQLAGAVLGTRAIVDGLTVAPTGPASLVVNVAPGTMYIQAAVDALGTYGSLAADSTHQIVKQGINLDTTPLTLTAPGTVGQSINYLIQAIVVEADANPVVLPYYNASNPAVPYTGPANAGTSQNTLRRNTVTVSAKPGAAATTGTQATPSPDAGYTGLAVVTVSQGQTQITGGSIVAQNSTNIVWAKLPDVPAAVQNMTWVYAADTGTADALAVTLTPPPAAYATGLRVVVKKGAAANATTTPTINVNALGTKTIVDRRGSAVAAADLPANAFLVLIYDGANFRFMGVVAADLGAQNTPFNQKQIISTTRTVFAAITGFTTFATGTYVKKSATSKLIVRLSTNVYDGGTGANCAVMRANIGSTNIETMTHVNDSATSSAAANTEREITGLAAGSYAYTISFGRNDATAWRSIINPTSASDVAYLPAVTGTSVIFAEIEP